MTPEERALVERSLGPLSAVYGRGGGERATFLVELSCGSRVFANRAKTERHARAEAAELA